ncbi:MAG: type I 3-dehydroquinate dehydratase [Candidatus Peribacteraceae bacterium]|nr:type I 3-dehydroquinate dehydratase [Candidatus Peribacteraceae bacterium]
MNPRIIIPLRPVSVADLKRQLIDVEDEADFIEVWLDRLKLLDGSKIKKIIKEIQKPLIINLKTKKEQGSSRLGDKKRVELLKLAAAAGADFIDLALDTPVALIRDLHKNLGSAKLILSFHDFKKMPQIERLRKIADKAQKLKADVVKIVGTAESFDDCAPIFQVSWELAKKKQGFLTMAMKEYGEPTRVITPLIGGLGMFAPIHKKDATAAGQMTVAELREWWKAFG